jgi:hypothetical protein
VSEFISDLTVQILVALLVVAISGFGTFITAMYRCLQKQSKSLFRLKKGFILYMQLQAKQTEELHPTGTGSMSDENISAITKEMMTDDEGKI